MATGSGEKSRTSRFGDQDAVSVSIAGPERLFLFDKLVPFSNVGGAVEFAATPIAALPKGNIIVLGGYLHLDVLESPAQANIIDTFALSYALGTVATVNNSLADATDFDLKTAVTLAAATGGVAPHSKGVLDGAKVMAMNPANAYIDNTAGSLAVFLNMTLPDAAVSGAGSLRVKGTLRLVTIGFGLN